VRPDLPRGGRPGRRVGDRGGPRRRFLRTPLRLPESRDPHAAVRRDRAHPNRRPRRCGPRRPRAVPTGRGPRAVEGGGPILIRPRAFAGLVLCAFLLGATWPVLGALPGEPARIVAGGAYAIPQGTRPPSLNARLASNIPKSERATTVRPDILGLTTLARHPGVVRGVDPDPFLRLGYAGH